MPGRAQGAEQGEWRMAGHEPELSDRNKGGAGTDRRAMQGNLGTGREAAQGDWCGRRNIMAGWMV